MKKRKGGEEERRDRKGEATRRRGVREIEEKERIVVWIACFA